MRASIKIAVGFLLILSVSALVAPARAANAADAAERWGLLGTWAVDCTVPPAGTRGRATFVRRGNQLFLERVFDNVSDSSLVPQATILPNGMISVTIVFKSLGETRVNVYEKDKQGRRRIFANHDTKGSFTVKDGIMLGSNAPPSWQTRCR